MNRYVLVIAYDGFNYSGWQCQKDAISIQAILQDTISTILQAKTRIVGSGRTDAKVHALAQVAHFDSAKNICENSFLISFNSLLPSDIRILSVQQITPDFHARFSVLKKTYHYYICANKIVLPHLRKTHLHVKEPFDSDLVKKACSYFIGKHDFTSFTNLGSSSKCMIRTIYNIDCIKTEVGYCLEFVGNGFLYKMVRNIVGLLLAVNQGKVAPDQIKSILEAKDRRCSPAAALPHGLFLMKVAYPKPFERFFPSKNTKLKLPVLELVEQDL